MEEADESLYWLQATKEADLVKHDDLETLIKEANELVSIFNASDITAKNNRDHKNQEIPKSQNQK